MIHIEDEASFARSWFPAAAATNTCKARLAVIEEDEAEGAVLDEALRGVEGALLEEEGVVEDLVLKEEPKSLL
jgi:hypothetical protein